MQAKSSASGIVVRLPKKTQHSKWVWLRQQATVCRCTHVTVRTEVVILLNLLSARLFDQNALCLSNSSEIAPKIVVTVITKNYKEVIHIPLHLANRREA
jgi:hypothetical protein